MTTTPQDGSKPSQRRAFGLHLEGLAATWLKARGLQLLQCNFLCRTGEIDLIMRDGEMLVFVEVRYRRSLRYGGPLESVTPRKRRSLLRCARFFLATHGHPDVPWRIDVLGVCPSAPGASAAAPGDGSQARFDFTWVQNAFS